LWLCDERFTCILFLSEQVKCQKVEAPGLSEDLAKKKNADLQNKEIIIKAKQKKQTSVIESEVYLHPPFPITVLGWGRGGRRRQKWARPIKKG